MKLLALLSHTLAHQARCPIAHRLRIGNLLLMTLIVAMAHFTASIYEGVGREMIRLLSGLDMLLIVVAGSSHFGSVITEEKEQGTLGLLKLAGFSNLGLLLGKSAARVLSVLLIFLLQLPFAFLGVMLGGVSPGQVIAVFLALAAFMILVGNLGLFFSLVCRRNSLAVSLTTLTGMLVIWGDSIIGFILTAGHTRRMLWVTGALQWIESQLNVISIDDRLRAIIMFRGADVLGPQVGQSLGLSVGLFLSAWALFDRFTEGTESVEREPRLSTRRWRLWSTTHVWKNAIVWKDFHFPSGGWGIWLAKGLVLAGAITAGVVFEAPYKAMTGSHLREIVAYGCVGLMIVEILQLAGNLFGEEYHSGTLPNLLLIPQSLSQMVFSKLWAGALHLIPSSVAALAAIGVAGKEHLYSGPQMRLLAWAAGLILLCHLTVFYSLRVKRGALAMACATLIIGGAVLLPSLAMATQMLLVDQRIPKDFQGPEAWAPLAYIAIMGCGVLQFATVMAIHRAGEEGVS